MTGDVFVEFVEQPVDQNDGPIRFVFEHGELGVILVDRAGQPVGCTDRFENEGGKCAVVGDQVGEIVHRADIGADIVERLLRLVPLADKPRIAGGGADLQARLDRRDQVLVLGRVRHGAAANLLQLSVMRVDLALQPVEIATKSLDATADFGTGAGAGSYSARREIAGSQLRQTGRNERLAAALTVAWRDVDTRRTAGRRFARQRRYQGFVGE